MFPQILQPLTQVPELSSDGAGSIHYLPATRATVLWGRLPCARDVGVLTVDSGDDVMIDTINDEGVLADQGRDPAAFFSRHGVPREFVLDDAIDLAASDFGRDPGSDGPHIVTGPIRARGARSCDLLKMTVLAYAYLSAATDFTISQVVDRVTGVHTRIRTADYRG
ncbi:hypothetical protein [Cryobacterium ruanii]|uniref:Uncharacterized protein n=1 Tax=Cryobacterium ruanii TaxID=1259197 RepID=A0A4V3IT96_9MICO|nr:hypothetical protein [Cryobacterium ruanii]TFD65300.1 hypothetical protein E3T47_10740 [Cryobacterium ruanii]